MARVGRPTKRTPETEHLLTEAFKVGSPIALACLYAGISEPAYFRWQQENTEFRDRMIRARAGSAVRNLALIAKAAPNDWRAAEAALKLSFPQIFAKIVAEHNVTVTVPEAATRTVDNVLEMRRIAS